MKGSVNTNCPVSAQLLFLPGLHVLELTLLFKLAIIWNGFHKPWQQRISTFTKNYWLHIHATYFLLKVRKECAIIPNLEHGWVWAVVSACFVFTRGFSLHPCVLPANFLRSAARLWWPSEEENIPWMRLPPNGSALCSYWVVGAYCGGRKQTACALVLPYLCPIAVGLEREKQKYRCNESRPKFLKRGIN